MTIEEVKKIEGVEVTPLILAGYRVYKVTGSLWKLRDRIGKVVKPIPTILAFEETEELPEEPLIVFPNESCEFFDKEMIEFTIYHEFWFYLNQDLEESRITKENLADIYAIKHTGVKPSIIVKILSAMEVAMDKNCGSLFRYVMMWREKRRVFKRAEMLIEQGAYEVKRAK